MVCAQERLGLDIQVVGGWEGCKPEINLHNAKVEFGKLATLRFGIPSRDLTKKIKGEISRADIVHLHSIWTGVISYGGWCSRVEKKPTILSPRGMLDKFNMQNRKLLKSSWYRLVEKKNISALSGFHFQDNSEREGCSWLGGSLKKPCIIQSNGSDFLGDDILLSISNHESITCHFKNNKSRKNLVFLGRLHSIKGLDLQVQLLADLHNVNLDAHLYLLGPDDGCAKSLEKLANELGVGRYLHLVGPVYGDDRLLWLRDADIVLLTSKYECNSNTAIETIAVGGVLVATDTCHLDQPAMAGAACVVPRNRKYLFKSVYQLIVNPEKARSIRKSAKCYAAKSLDWNKLANDMVKFYEKCIR
jgi:glycosyltransferase involved in cell wall biosynthesis